MAATNFSTIYPTLNYQICGTSNCPIGGSCTSTSQCATGGCCGFYDFNQPDQSAFDDYRYLYQNISGSLVTASNETYMALTGMFYRGLQCLPSTSGQSTTSYYNPANDTGFFTIPWLTGSYTQYQCNQNKTTYSPGTNVFAGLVPVVNITQCPSGQNCTTGSACNVDSQCALGNCCAYMFNTSAIQFLNNGKTVQNLLYNNTKKRDQDKTLKQNGVSAWKTEQQSTFDAIYSQLYVPGRYCLSRIPGNSTFTAYNQTSDYGEFVNGANTTMKVPYSCASYISYVGVGFQSASILEAMQALILAAFSLAYLNLA